MIRDYPRDVLLIVMLRLVVCEFGAKEGEHAILSNVEAKFCRSKGRVRSEETNQCVLKPEGFASCANAAVEGACLRSGQRTDDKDGDWVRKHCKICKIACSSLPCFAPRYKLPSERNIQDSCSAADLNRRNRFLNSKWYRPQLAASPFAVPEMIGNTDRCSEFQDQFHACWDQRNSSGWGGDQKRLQKAILAIATARIQSANSFNLSICHRCAIVGSSGDLQGRKFGADIDSHDIVIRINAAPTFGFESDVGNRTTARVLYPEGSYSPLLDLEAEQEAGTLMLMTLHSPGDVDWLLHNVMQTDPDIACCSSWQTVAGVLATPYTNVQIIPPAAWRGTSEHLPGKGKPTTGLMTIYWALHTLCEAVDLYGFSGFRRRSRGKDAAVGASGGASSGASDAAGMSGSASSGAGDASPFHYFESTGSMKGSHLPLSTEAEPFWALVDDGILRVYPE
jgi:hypothetical protein